MQNLAAKQFSSYEIKISPFEYPMALYFLVNAMRSQNGAISHVTVTVTFTFVGIKFWKQYLYTIFYDGSGYMTF
jgi:hypothetical protein